MDSIQLDHKIKVNDMWQRMCKTDGINSLQKNKSQEV